MSASLTTLATVSVPNTSGWQTWQTVSKLVTLQRGEPKGGRNIAVIAAGTGRYVAQCTALDRFLKNATTFLGPKLFFLEPWEIPSHVARPSSNAAPRTLKAHEMLLEAPIKAAA